VQDPVDGLLHFPLRLAGLILQGEPAMRRYLTTCSFIVFILIAVLAATGGATNHRFIESFNTKLYCDTLQTTALWDTVAGELKLPPFEMSLTGTYNTAGNARGIAIDGNYAFVADYSAGLQVINITNPASPTLAGTYDTPGNAKGVAVDGNYAFVADYATGLIVVNVTNPATPTPSGTYDTPGSARDVAIDGNYAYVADYASGLIVVNITTPTSPTLAGSYDTPGTALGVAVAGNYAYVADGTAGLQVINITNPASPTLAGTYDTPGSAYDVAIAGDRAYIADGTGLQVINIASPASPILAGSLRTMDGAYVVAVDGDYAYLADAAAGLLEIDISNPAAPTLIDTYDTPGNAYGVAVDGNQAFVADDVWGLQVVKVSMPIKPWALHGYPSANPYFDVTIDGDYAYVAGGTNGLRVFDITTPGSFVFAGGYDTPGAAGSVAIAGDYAFVADGADGLIVLNIANPASPTLAGSYDTPGSAWGVTVAGDYAYIADATAGLLVLNVSNPASPTYVGSYDTPYAAYEVAIAGDYAYVPDGTTGLLVINISNPASPTLAGSCNTPDLANGVTLAGDYAFVADGSSGVQVINITNPASPTIAGAYDTPGSAFDVAVVGNYAYVADYSSGLQVLNITNPASPTFVASTYLPSYSYGVAVAGDFVFDAVYTSGLIVARIAQRDLEDSKNLGRSLAVASTPEEMVKMRISTVQADSIKWELSANGGTNWTAAPLRGQWYAVTPRGSSPLWRSTHVLSDYPHNPSCSQLEIDWLYASAVIDSIRDIPGDQGGQVRIYCARSGYDFSDEVTHPISMYYLWRRMDDPVALRAIAQETDPSAATAAMSVRVGMTAGEISGTGGLSNAGAPAGLPVVKWNGRLILRADRSALSQSFPPGTWEIVGSAPGAQKDQYVNVVPTLADSTVEGMVYAVYLVTAHTTTPSVWYASAPDSGYSLDNFAPHVPTSFAVAYNSGGGNDLSWDTCPDYDFEYFRVYRGESEDFVPAPGNLVQMTIDRGWLDTVEDGYSYYYKITAVDHAGNESAPASAGTVTGTDPPAMPKAFALYQNVPNPFNPTTRIRFDLPEAADVRLAVYNVNGQVIRVLADAEMPAGAREVMWDGRDAKGRAAASGIYFYRIDAGRFTQTRKMILLR